MNGLLGTTYVLNSIVMGSNGGEDIHTESGATVKLYYTVYGQANASTDISGPGNQDGWTAEEVFGTLTPTLADNGGPTQTIQMTANGYGKNAGALTAYFAASTSQYVYAYHDGAAWVWLDGGSHAATEITVDQRQETRSTDLISAGSYQADDYVAWRVNGDNSITYYSTLNWAFDDSNADRILSGETLYIVDRTVSGAGNYNVTVDVNVTITGTDQNADDVYTILDAEGLGRFFTINSLLNVSISNITFTNGSASEGGAIYNSGTLSISDSSFSGNTATTNGGAIYSLGNLTIENSTFTGNSAAAGNGGAIYLTGASTVTVDIKGDTLFEDNSAGNGGGIYATGGLTLNIGTIGQGGSVQFKGNTASNGGGIYANGVTIEIGDNTIFQSNAIGGMGGGIYMGGGSVVSITGDGSKFDQNTSTGNYGAAVAVAGAGDKLIVSGENTIFNENKLIGTTSSDCFGGAIYLGGSAALEITGEGTTFTGNQTRLDKNTNGGAIFGNGGSSITIKGNNIVFSDNKSSNHGGAIDVRGTLYIEGTGAIGVVFRNNVVHNTGKLGTAVLRSNGGGAIAVVKSSAASVVTATIKGVTFDGNKTIGTSWTGSSTSSGSGGAVLVLGAEVKIDNCDFTGNSVGYWGGAIASGYWTLAAGLGDVTVSNSTFTGNTAGALGGAISTSVTGTSVSSSYKGYGKVMVVNCSFENNYAGTSGGAVYAFASGTFTIKDATGTPLTSFSGNYAGSTGGAIYAGHDLTLDKIDFDGNYTNGSGTTRHGGAVYANASLTVNGGTFINNKAGITGTTGNGGAIYANGALTVDAAAVFGEAGKDNGNSAINGGAIYAASTSATVAVSINGSYYDNNAITNGGAVYLAGTATIAGGIFAGNSAASGGAVYANHASNLLTVSGGTFTNNTATSGGAVYAKGVLTVGSAAVFGNASDNTKGNSATEGGAIYVNSATAAVSIGGKFYANKATTGGAIYSVGVTAIDGAAFTGNAATGNGGGIYSTGTLTIKNGSTFTSNTAASGGAVYSSSKVTIGTAGADDNVIFSKNIATGRGGAIFSTGTVEIAGNGTEFNENTAISGGAIGQTGAILTISGDNTIFSKNKGNTEGYGGAVYFSAGTTGVFTISGNGTRFNENYAERTTDGRTCGGAIFLDAYTKLYITGNNTFFQGNISIDNVSSSLSSRANGGAIFSGVDSLIEITGDNTRFIGNQADNYGGAIAAFGTVTIKARSQADGVAAVFQGNTLRGASSSNAGGAVYISYRQGMTPTTSTLENIKFIGNKATAGGTGGAVYSHGAIVNISNSIFDGNQVKNHGGAIAGGRWDSTGLQANFTIDNCDFTGNEAGNGGAISTYGVKGSCNVTIKNSEFAGNKAVTSGGAIYYYTTTSLVSTVDIDALTAFKSNEAGVDGGAIYAGGAFTLNGGIFTNNTAVRNGGAVYASAALTVKNGVIFGKFQDELKGNSAANGGAIYAASATAAISITGGGYYFNKTTGGDGGAIYTNGALTVSDSVFDNNETTNGGGGAIYGASTIDISADSKFYYNMANDGIGGGAVYGKGVITIADSDFTFSRANGVSGGGGAIYGEAGISVSGSLFDESDATNSGGAIYGASTVDITDSSFSHSRAVVSSMTGGPAGGGAVYAAGALTVNNSTFDNNSTFSAGDSAYGGALYGGSTVDITDSSFDYNNAAEGAGGAVYAAGALTVDNSTFDNNASWNSYGGAVYGASTVEINDSKFNLNLIHGDRAYGGAVYAVGELMVSHSEFRGNSAAMDGGAIYAAGAKVTMDNTLIADGTATGNGGAIYFADAAVAAVLTNLTIVNNTAAAGGGIYTLGSDIAVRNSILWGNKAGSIANQYFGLDNTKVSFSGIQGWIYDDYATRGNVNLHADNSADGIGVLNLNETGKYYVCFVDEANGDYHLNAGSYAINRGSNSYVNMPETDLDGANRIYGSIVDMGAYEALSKGNVVLTGKGTHIIYGDSDTVTVANDGYGGGGYTYTSRDTDSVTMNGDRATAVWADKSVDVDIEYKGDDNWNSASITVKVTTEQRDLVIKAKDDSHVYDGKDHQLDWNGDASGFVLDDDLLSYVNDGYRYVGTYTGTEVISDAVMNSATRGDVTGNYRIKYEGSLTITLATLVITGDSGSRTYDGAYHDYSYTDNGGLGSGDKIGSIVNGTNSYRNANTYSNLQSGAIVVDALGNDMTGNYDIKYVAGEVVINQATLIIKGDSGSRTYDGAYHDYSYTETGLQGSDRINSIVDGTNSYRNANTYSNLQSGAVVKNTAGENMTGNYDIKYVAGEVVIDQATLIIKGDSGSRTYDGAYHDYSYTETGLQGSDRINSIVDGTNSYRNANTYSNLQSGAVVKNTAGENMTGNYDIKYVAGEVVIDQAVLTITGTSDERTYDGQYHDYSVGSVNGLVGDDRLDSVDGQYSWRNADTYENLQSNAVIKNTGNENMTGNYDIKYVAGEVVINKATITVTRDGTDKEYDGNTDAEYTWKVEGVKGNDKVTYTEGDASFLDKNVGDNKTVNFIGDSLDADLRNYEVKYVDLGADITPARLVIVIDDKTKNEGEIDPAFTGTVTGLVGGDTVDGYNRTNKGESSGQYAIDQFQLHDDNGGGNYTVIVHEGTLTILAPAPINIYSDASSRRYVINGQHQASLINSLSTMTANRDVDAVLDTENSGSVGSASHQTTAKAGDKMKTNLRENSQKKSFEDYDQQVVQQRTNSMLVKSGLFADKAEKSVVESQYKTNDKAGSAQVQMPVNDFSGAQNTSFQSDHPMHNMPSNINIDASGVNVVNFSGIDLADVTVMEKIENLKDTLDLLLEEMVIV